MCCVLVKAIFVITVFSLFFVCVFTIWVIKDDQLPHSLRSYQQA